MSQHDTPWHSDLTQRLASEADLQLDSSQWAAHVASEGIIEVLYDVSELAEADHFIERVKQQLHILRDLRHENIVEFQGWMAQKDGNLFSVVAISRKCEGGEVIGFLHSHKGADHQQLVLGVTVGLNFLHSKKIVHGSLSPRKIFIDCTSERPIAKIGGFDLCHLSETPVYPNEEYWSSLLIRYTAPEVLTGDDVECDMRSDVWSYACTSLEILLGNPPYTSKNIWDDLLIPQAAMDGIPPYERRSLDGFDGVLMSCLEHEPSRRPPIDQVNTQLEGLFLRIRIERELMQEDERNLAKAVQLDQLPVPEGYSASPYPGTYNGGPVCIQQINIPIPPLDDLMRALKRQIRIQRRLIHPNIEQLYGWVLSPETESSISLSLVTTWYPHRDLMGYLRQHPATNRRKMVYHIALGLCYLHSEGVVHADIKPENVVIGDEGNPCLRGFQFTYDRLDELRPSDIPQDLSARFRPPELLQESRKIPDQWSDVWAFGCVGVEILIGESPYSYLPDNQVPIVAANSGRPYEWGDLDGFESTIAECLSHPPENRISMKDVRDTLDSWLAAEATSDIYNTGRQRNPIHRSGFSALREETDPILVVPRPSTAGLLWKRSHSGINQPSALRLRGPLPLVPLYPSVLPPSPSISLLSAVPVQKKAGALRQKIDDLLLMGGVDIAPPLKMATSGALSILDEAKKLKDDKKEWTDFGEYVVDTVAEVVSAIKSYDASAEEAKPWVESITKLNRVLQTIRSEIERRQKIAEKRPAVLNVVSYLRDTGRIDGLKKDFDKTLASFQLRTNLMGGAKLAAIERHLQDDKILDSLRYPHINHDDFTQACLEGTRIDLTERIMTWCRNTEESENRLLLLTAVAGAGKTSIALTIAERCASEGDVTLLLHFFFKAGERSRPDFLFSGIARTLADHDPFYRTFIISTLQKDPSLSTAVLAKQFENLVALPLLHKPPDRPMVVIIDALDECDKEVFESFADILRQEVPKLPSSIKFFITSRHTDLVIRTLSPLFPISRLAIDLSDDANAQDCATYIRFELQKLKDWHPDLRRNLQDEDKIVQEIWERASGLFVWISTIFRYMKTANNDPMRALEGLLDTGAKRAEGMMDHLYTNILKKCNWEDEDFSHDYPIVMGAIFVAQQPLSVTAWNAILSPFLKSPVQYSLAELAPLVSGADDSHFPIRILHQSFRGFFVDRIDPPSISPRCIPVDVVTANARVALRCAEILNQDLCSVQGLGLIETLSEQDELPLIPSEELPEHSHYACRHIVHHLSGVQEPSEELDGSVDVFLNHQATRWVEVCVRMEGYIGISLLPEWAKLAVSLKSRSAVCTLASMLVRLARNLYFFARFQGAYEAANDSVVLCRYLLSVDPGSYSPDLAESLGALYLALSKLGRHSEALPFIEESINLYRQLVAVYPGSYTADLAVSLNNLPGALSKLGRHSEALPFIEESVNLHRQLVAVHPGLYTADLAVSLNNLYLALSNLGRHSEALSFIEESVKLRRQLVAVHPGLYTPDLAMSLNNLYDALSNLERHSESLSFIEESVKLRRQLVAVHPGSYTPDLSMSLNNLYCALSNLGRHSEALQFIVESVKLRRQLVAAHPGSYTPNLATSLSNLYSALSNLGRHSEALPFIEEGVKIWRQLVESNPGAYTPQLANSLRNLRNALSNLGRHSEAQMVHS